MPAHYSLTRQHLLHLDAHPIRHSELIFYEWKILLKLDKISTFRAKILAPNQIVLGVCHRMSSHPTKSARLDRSTRIVSLITAFIVYDIANTRGLDGDLCHLVKPGGVIWNCHGSISSRFCYSGESILKFPAWYRQRRYLHFDEPMGFSKAKNLAENPSNIVKHAFWPLISFEIVSWKIKEDSATRTLYKKQKNRTISYAAHSDSHIFSYYCSQISDVYEKTVAAQGLGDAVLAFRPLGKNNIDFAKQAFTEIRRQGDCTAIAFDISKFFDTLDHALLKNAWKELLGFRELPPDHFSIFKNLTKFSQVYRDELFSALDISTHNPRSNGRRRLCEPQDFRLKVRDGGLIKKNKEKMGIPQGTSISALLSNVYMLKFDLAAQQEVCKVGGSYLRYCDDMLFIIPHENWLYAVSSGN